MKINNEFFGLLQEQNVLKTTKTKPIVGAIQDRHPLTFYYSGPYKPKNASVKRGTRFQGEPVALGLSKKGNLIVRMFIPSPNVSKKGFDKTNWRTFMVSRMSNVQIVDDKVFDQRPGYKEGEESKSGPMSVTYMSANFGKKPETKKPQKVNPVKAGKPAPEIQPKNPENKVNPVIPGNPEVEPTKQGELPQIKQKTKPEPIQKPTEPEINKNDELPQIKPEDKPSIKPEDDVNKNLQEEMKRMKSLISY